jgi:hypothetical protein
MSKTNDTSNIATLEDHEMLADTQLDAVSGGFWFMGSPGATDRVEHPEFSIVKFVDAATP